MVLIDLLVAEIKDSHPKTNILVVNVAGVEICGLVEDRVSCTDSKRRFLCLDFLLPVEHGHLDQSICKGR